MSVIPFLYVSVEYKLSTEKKTWSTAIENCNTWGGFVAAPTNPSSNAVVWLKLKTKYEE